ncbi:MAG: response regulator [Proteobacteria bacterium]|nr:response regulator [Pseudomonadota bacterium]
MKILVVDDSEAARKPIAIHLGELGHHVIEANNGLEALELYQSMSFDLIISDIRMPEMNGLDLLRRVKAIDPDQEMIIVTGHGDMDSTLVALRLGAANYLMKPLRLEEAALAVERIDTKRALQARLQEQEDRLLRAQKMADLGLVAAGVAHEINNPNTFVQGNIQTLAKFCQIIKEYIHRAEAAGVAKPDRLDFVIQELPGVLKASLEGTERIRRIVNNLAAFTRRDPDENLGDIDLNQSVGQAIEAMGDVLGGVRVKTLLASGLPPVRAAQRELIDIVTEILKNSVKALDGCQDPEIEINTYQSSPDSVVLAVEDNGPGVDPKNLDKVCVPFYTSDPIIGRPGLGMSKVYARVTRFGGDIVLANRPDRGFRVTIRLLAS